MKYFTRWLILGLLLPGVQARAAYNCSYGPPPYEESREHVGVMVPNPPTHYYYDSRSLVKTWIFKDHPAQAPEPLVEFAEPRSTYTIVGRTETRSTKTLPPVPVLLMKPGGKPAVWEIGSLPIGTYMFRVIGAIPAADQVSPPKHLVISFTINDRVDGSKSQYVLRGRGVDTFYCVQEFGFHVVDDRKLVAEIGLLPDSETSLNTYNVEIHDVLAGCAKQAGKSQPSFFTLPERDMARKAYAATDEGAQSLAAIQKEEKHYTPAERQRRDEHLWNSVPGINIHVTFEDGANKNFMVHSILFNPPEPETAKAPRWGLARLNFGNYNSGWDQRYALALRADGRSANKGELYTLEDFLSHQPLGNTGDRGWGVRQSDSTATAPDPARTKTLASYKNLRKGDALVMPTAPLNSLAWAVLAGKLSSPSVNRYHLGGDEVFARDLSILLVRLAYDLPTFSVQHSIDYLTDLSEIPWRRDRYYHWPIFSEDFAVAYDKLFPFIQNNQELAAAVGRFIPWVKTPQDVIKILDTGLVQYIAKNIFPGRYFNDNGTADMLLTVAGVQANATISEPWMSRLWEKGVYFYPLGNLPLPEAISINTTRDGTTTIGSIIYTENSGPAYDAATLIEPYLRTGGNPQYDLRNFDRYPKAVAGCYWPLESPVAGLNYLGVGDVGGPSEAYGRGCQPDRNARNGWKWTHDPKFAWLLANLSGRLYETDEEWAAIQKAAATIPDPIMNRRSRVLTAWSGILESGVGQPDFRFHEAAAVRVGTGFGHNHQDALDLRVWAHGLTMLGDLGQRGGYGEPDHEATICHNVVQIDEDNQSGSSWVDQLSDLNGVQYLQAEAIPLRAGQLKRQVVLIDVDQGQPSTKADPRKDPAVRTPNSYIFDVCRTAGGSVHTLCFHGCVDDLNFAINIPEKDRQVFPRDQTAQRKELERSNPEVQYLKNFRWTRPEYMGPEFRPPDADWAATCQADTLQATWRLARPAEHRMIEENSKVGGVMTEPRKFTRLHVFNTAGLRVLHGIVIDKIGAANINPGINHYAGRCIFVRKPGSESIFTSLVEPYAGDPFILATKPLKVEPATTGPSAPVAAEVTVNVAQDSGPGIRRTDILYADNSGAPHTLPEHALSVQGEFAMIQEVNHQVVKACLLRGRQLKLPDFELDCAFPEYRATITAIDYVKREVTLESKVPAAAFKGAYVVIGDTNRWTGYDISDVFERGGVSVLKIPQSLELKRTHLVEVKPVTDPAGPRVEMTLGVNVLRDQGVWVANGDYSKVWRLHQLPKEDPYRPASALTPADFEGGKAVMITLEIGVGQAVILPTKAMVERKPDGSYKVSANVTGKFRAEKSPWQEFGIE